LAPVLTLIRGTDTLSFARFYSAPFADAAHRGAWQAFRWANRHVPGLDFFQGYRNKDGREKVIDVALAVDLVYGCACDHFDRVAIIGGDGDHIYAYKVAKTMGKTLRVYLLPGQESSALAHGRIAFTRWEIADLLAFCAYGSQADVPPAHAAPKGHHDATPRLTGPLASLVI